MKKTLLLLAIPTLMLTACGGKSQASKQAVSWTQFQDMTERSIAEGLLVNATFRITFDYYSVNESTGEKTKIDVNCQSYSIIKEGMKMYVEDRGMEFIFDFNADKSYLKQDGHYVDQGMSPNNYNAYNHFGNAVRVVQYDIMGEKKNGKYSSTDSTISYKMNGEQKVEYSILYGKVKNNLDYFRFYERSYYYSSQAFFDYQVFIDSYSGTVPAIE